MSLHQPRILAFLLAVGWMFWLSVSVATSRWTDVFASQSSLSVCVLTLLLWWIVLWWLLVDGVCVRCLCHGALDGRFQGVSFLSQATLPLITILFVDSG
ncbi:hypothetical protein [Allorhodopirellula heiligendammensis]|uniref:Uncharacterized protein n=1 Tax=Allorhodopirellula heiligendammensis TaxID=2714739 RepID=A0A5C6BDS8_9BACT|nr:hypothetical protein [Allorhodopirellula heiligendammensis]TWU09892.1 hypothetical protein Poly21_54410 [Allorhodopirellula heiligendammensis]